MSEFTKGNWEVDDILILADNTCVARVFKTHHPEESVEANAHLIAAAPAMYEALKSIKSWLLEDSLIEEGELLNEQFVKANNLVNKVLSKAEGK